MTGDPLNAEEIGRLLVPYTGPFVSEGAVDWARMCERVSVYTELLLRWNERTNLTSIRDGREIVRRHFGESFFLARHMNGAGTVLDLGSGAGFPGIPVQLWSPELRMTLAESQGKKAAFLREVVRTLCLETEVWGGRVEDLPGDRLFRNVVMRAVDRPSLALSLARKRAEEGVWVLGSRASVAQAGGDLVVEEEWKVPGSEGSFLFHFSPARVPRGT